MKSLTPLLLCFLVFILINESYDQYYLISKRKTCKGCKIFCPFNGHKKKSGTYFMIIFMRQCLMLLLDCCQIVLMLWIDNRGNKISVKYKKNNEKLRKFPLYILRIVFNLVLILHTCFWSESIESSRLIPDDPEATNQNKELYFSEE